MSTSSGGVGSFVQEHPWMTFFLGYTTIMVVGEIFGARSKPAAMHAPAAASPLPPMPVPTPAVAGMPSWGAPEADHPWLGGVSFGADTPREPARVKFGPVMATVAQGRHVAIVAPAGIGTLSPAGLSSSDPSVLAPTTLPDGQQGFIAIGPGFATVRGQYIDSDGTPFNASVPIQIASA